MTGRSAWGIWTCGVSRANSGDNIVLRIGKLTDGGNDFDPWIRLYGPDGTLLGPKTRAAGRPKSP